MTNTSDLIASLELASERVEEPDEAIYAHLFTRHPEMEDLFLMDRDGGVRGSMLQQAFDCLIDLAGSDGTLASVILSSERINHKSYDVPDDLFMSLFDAIKQVIAQTLGPDWTPGMEAEWTETLIRADRLSREAA